MAYSLKKTKMVELLTTNAEYFPFEQIRDFKHLQTQPIEIAEDVKKDYFTFFRDAKMKCEHMLRTQPNNKNCDLWKEAIEEINSILA